MIEEKDLSDFLVEQAEENGVSVAAVSDGHVFVFTAERLKALLASAAAYDGKAVVFVKNPVRA